LYMYISTDAEAMEADAVKGGVLTVMYPQSVSGQQLAFAESLP
jgi:hypothetical protein